ncbi:MAG: hypothetical protein LH702_21540 [Phormidesmis sp. CAN_BIN44]|nr:hypothetical protein [Phormidesmis sp. CAN_BIN44]
MRGEPIFKIGDLIKVEQDDRIESRGWWFLAPSRFSHACPRSRCQNHDDWEEHYEDDYLRH